MNIVENHSNNKDQLLTCSPHVFTKNNFRIQSDSCFDDKTITNKQFKQFKTFLPKEVIKELKRKQFKISSYLMMSFSFFRVSHVTCLVPIIKTSLFFVISSDPIRCLDFFCVCVVCLCFISVLQKRQ